MAEHQNAAIIRQMTDAFTRGDMAALAGFFAEDVVWHEIGRSEPRRGTAELSQMAEQASALDYQITATVHDIVSNDEHTIALLNATATRGGETFNYRTAEIFHIRDGKIVERWAFSDDTAAIAEFFA